MFSAEVDGGKGTTFLLGILDYQNPGRSPMVLQDMPNGLRKKMPAEQYRALKQKVDNALLPVFVVARRLRLAGLCSGGFLLFTLVCYLALVVAHVYVAFEDLLGFMLPALCPIGGVILHLLFHRFRRQKMSSTFQAMKAHLRGILKWESDKFICYNFKLRCDEATDERVHDFSLVRIEITVFSPEEIMERSFPPSPVDGDEATPRLPMTPVCETPMNSATAHLSPPASCGESTARSIPPSPIKVGEASPPMCESPMRSPVVHVSAPALEPPFIDITRVSKHHIEEL